MMDELLEVKNKIQSLNSEESKNCFTNLKVENLNSRCSDRLNSPLQNDVVNLKKSVKERNDIDFRISTSNRFNHLTVNEPGCVEVGQVGQLHTVNRQNKKSALPFKN